MIDGWLITRPRSTNLIYYLYINCGWFYIKNKFECDCSSDGRDG